MLLPLVESDKLERISDSKEAKDGTPTDFSDFLVCVDRLSGGVISSG